MEFMYEHTDIPPGLTLADWRRARPRRERWTLFAGLRSSLSPRRYSPVGGSYFARSSTSR
jgi:hypothetical protein